MNNAPARFLVTASSAVFLLACPVAGGAADKPAHHDQAYLLWPDGAPKADGNQDIDQPWLTVHLPEPAQANGTAVIVNPGGGYRILASDHEGLQVARWLNRHGVAAFVLRYRLGPKYAPEVALLDAQRAVRYVRGRAADFGVSPKRVGMLGFSAGGHLTAAAGTSFDPGDPAAEDPIERDSSRPDFLVPVYAAISPALFEREVTWSALETQVTADTPPTFLVHTHQDGLVVPEHSIRFYQALHQAGVPAELHIFTHGPHGSGLAPGDPDLSQWQPLLLGWLRRSALLTDRPRAAVSGEVTVDGKPLYWGWLTFLPEDESLPTAVSYLHFSAKGAFEIPAETGPCPGRYRVEVHRVSTDFSAQQSGAYSMEDAERLLLPGTVEIAPGSNQIRVAVSSR
jgi:acetyl esterase/lipase